jgi:predicted Fe-S protein YdhL (DUF1289 family)
MTKPATPCANICHLDPVQMLCVGCGRHMDEIKMWPNLTNEQRKSIMQQVRERQQKMKNNAGNRNHTIERV